MNVDYDGDPIEDRPEPTVSRFQDIKPVTFAKNDIGANADYHGWFYDLPEDQSEWFHLGAVVKLEPGEYVDFHTHTEAVEGSYEEFYWVLDGTARLRTEYWDTTLERFDCAYFPTGAAHQLGNAGTATLWFGAWASLGGNEMAVDIEGMDPVDRPGYVEEYERIMAARSERGLPVPGRVDQNYDGDPIEDRPEPVVRRFQEIKPVTYGKSRIGANADYQVWYYHYPESEWFFAGNLAKLEPGEYVDFHTHTEAVEGPYEEFYWVLDGTARLRTEYWDTTLERFDCAYFPTDAAHQLGNAGTDTLWFGAWVSLGGNEMAVDIEGMNPEDRPGYLEEYERIMAARSERGLPVPGRVNVE